MNTQQVVSQINNNIRFKRVSSPTAAFQLTELELLQEECEEDMVNFIRAARAGRAKRALARERKDQNRAAMRESL